MPATPAEDTTATRVSRPPRRTGEETRRAVVEAARAQIEAAGLITLNVASVARACGINETLIYRHFRSRSGLLEETLGQMWDDHAAASRVAVETLLLRIEDLARPGTDPHALAGLARLADVLPSPGTADDARARLLLIQIIAASATLPELRRRMAETQRAQDAAIEHALESALGALPQWHRTQMARAMRAMLTGMALGFAISDLDAQRSPDDTDLRALWTDLIGRLIEPSQLVGAAR